MTHSQQVGTQSQRPEDYTSPREDWLQLYEGVRLLIDEYMNVDLDFQHCPAYSSLLKPPSREQILYRVICWHLSAMPRFIGATPMRYSVAQHSALCWALGHKMLSDDRESPIWIHLLLHDAHEAFMGDFPRPLFRVLSPETKMQFVEMKTNIQLAILRYLDVPPLYENEAIETVKLIDDMALKVEKEWFFGTAIKAPEWEIDNWELPTSTAKRALNAMIARRPPENSDFAKLLSQALRRHSPYDDTSS